MTFQNLVALYQINTPHIILVLHVAERQLVYALVVLVLTEEPIVRQDLRVRQLVYMVCDRVGIFNVQGLVAFST